MLTINPSIYLDSGEGKSAATTVITRKKSYGLEIEAIKVEIAKILQTIDLDDTGNGIVCRNLRCKCVVSETDFADYVERDNFDSSFWTSDRERRLQHESDVSNSCLIILRFLILDEPNNLKKNVDLLFQNSIKFLDKKRNSDEIMTEVMYPIYEQLFDEKYRLIRDQNDFDPEFFYDQRYDEEKKSIYRTLYDENFYLCQNGTICSTSLDALVEVWQKLTNVLNFEWHMDLGSMVSNFNFLLDSCSGKWNADNSIQTNEKVWAPYGGPFRGQCTFGDGGKLFYGFVGDLTSSIVQLPFKGIYLNDVLGYLGYSTKFDLKTIQQSDYLAVTRNLHPVYGTDVHRNLEDQDNWHSCNYLATYQRWVMYTSRQEMGANGCKFVVF